VKEKRDRLMRIEERIGLLLKERKLKLTLAESCTGGLVSHRITNIPGSSDYYLGSVTAYANEAKRKVLGVKPETLLEFGAVSRETVLEMAYGVRAAFAGEERLIDQIVGVSISGIAGPGGGMPGKPVGLVWVGLSAADGRWAWRKIWGGDRAANKRQSAQWALTLLQGYLTGKLPPEND
jgi:PncC family amidohydrolase